METPTRTETPRTFTALQTPSPREQPCQSSEQIQSFTWSNTSSGTGVIRTPGMQTIYQPKTFWHARTSARELCAFLSSSPGGSSNNSPEARQSMSASATRAAKALSASSRAILPAGLIATDCAQASVLCMSEVHPSRFARAKTVPSGIFMRRAISRNPIPAECARRAMPPYYSREPFAHGRTCTQIPTGRNRRQIIIRE